MRFYFIPPSYQSKRFLQERILLDISTSTEFKYETANDVNDFKKYELDSSNLTVSEDAQDNIYIVTNPNYINIW